MISRSNEKSENADVNDNEDTPHPNLGDATTVEFIGIFIPVNLY